MERFLVAQLGARMHYAVPRILQEAGMLETLHTDICAVRGWPVLLKWIVPRRLQPKGLKRLFGRLPHGVPTEKIRTYSKFGWEYARRRQRASTRNDAISTHLWAAKAFNKLVLASGLREATGVYVYNSAGLELLRKAKQYGLLAIMEQTGAARQKERELLSPEYERHQGHNQSLKQDSTWQQLVEREKEEWEAADVILCGSQFVVDSILAVGGPVEKTIVVPYGIDVSVFQHPFKLERSRDEFRVLFVGKVSFAKGAYYLIEAVRLLEKRNLPISLRLVGAVTLPREVLDNLPSNIQLTGPVPRAEIKSQFECGDVFCLPSLSEGSAAVTYEALAMGLPVICTPNTGSVIRNGVDGFIVPVRNASAIADALELLWNNVDLYFQMRLATQEQRHYISLESYAQRLLAIINSRRKEQ